MMRMASSGGDAAHTRDIRPQALRSLLRFHAGQALQSGRDADGAGGCSYVVCESAASMLAMCPFPRTRRGLVATSSAARCVVEEDDAVAKAADRFQIEVSGGLVANTAGSY